MLPINRIKIGLLKRFGSFLPDKLYLKLRYKWEMGKPLDFSNCQTMNEKLQWLKIYNRQPILTDFVDKINVKDIIAKKIGSQYIIPTLKVWESPDDITEADIASLPDSFVMKTNHSGGNTGVIICRDKSKFDLTSAINKMRASLKADIYKNFREWPYKNVKRRIFVESYLGDDLVDYKFYCFNGEVDSVLTCSGRQTKEKTKFYFFDKDWNLCRYNKAGKAAPEGFSIPKPEGIDKMFEIAAILSEGIPMVRVDLYNINGKIYFGEMTFYPASGFDANRLPEADLYFGKKINLDLVKAN